MNGRALFTYNPDVFVDDEAAAGEEDFVEEEAKVDKALFAAGDAEEEVEFD